MNRMRLALLSLSLLLAAPLAAEDKAAPKKKERFAILNGKVVTIMRRY